MEPISGNTFDLDYLRAQIVGVDTSIDTPYGRRLMLYADYTASGRSLHFVEDYVLRQLQLYANSHTEDDTSGRVTTELLHQAEECIKQAVNAGPDGRIIACGTGATGAIDRMQQLVGVKLPAARSCPVGRTVAGVPGRPAGQRNSRSIAEVISRWCSSDPTNTTPMRSPGARAW